MLRTQMMIDRETKEELERLAVLEKTSMAKLVREFIGEGVKKRKTKARKKRKKLTLGKFLLKLSENAGRSKGKGKGDLAMRHDYYLYGEGRIK